MFRIILFCLTFLASSEYFNVICANKVENAEYKIGLVEGAQNDTVRQKRETMDNIYKNLLQYKLPVMSSVIFEIAIQSLLGPNVLRNFTEKLTENLAQFAEDLGKKMKSKTPVVKQEEIAGRCVINIKILAENHALILKKVDSTQYEFKKPDNEAGNITLLSGESLFLSCGHWHNFFELIPGISYSLVTCVQNITFSVVANNHKIYNFYKLTCDSIPPYQVANYSSHYDGDVLLKRFYFSPIPDSEAIVEVMDVHFRQSTLRPYYAKNTIPGIIAGGQSAASEREFSETDCPLNSAYAKQKERDSEFRSQLLCINAEIHTCSYFNVSLHNEFVPSLLTHPSNFLYQAAGIPTYNYINSGPQWPRIRDGNWAHIQAHIYELAKGRKSDLEVYTGTYGRLELIDYADNLIEKEMFLNPDEASEKKNSLSIPHYFWKIAYEPATGLAVAFITVNNPFITCGFDYHLCSNPRSKQDNVLMPRDWEPENFQKGYSYMCDVNDFLDYASKTTEKIRIAGSLPAIGLLHLTGNYWPDDFDHTYLLTLLAKAVPEYVDNPGDCKFNVDILEERTPMVAHNWTYTKFADFYYPDDRGIVTIDENTNPAFICSGTTNQFTLVYPDKLNYLSQNGIHRFLCSEGYLRPHALENLWCRENHSFEILLFDEAPPELPLKVYWIHLFAVDQKLNFIKLYYDESTTSTVYVEYRMRRSVAARQKGIETLARDLDDVGCCPGLNAKVKDFYDITSQKNRFGVSGSNFQCLKQISTDNCDTYEKMADETGDYQTLAQLINSSITLYKCIIEYFNQYEDCNFFDFDGSKYFVPTLLAPPTHFPFKTLANGTFTYMNTRPMWKSISEGNWVLVNKFVYELVKSLDEDEIIVYSGAGGILQLANAAEYEDIKLSIDGYKTLPVPKYFWKFVYSPETNKGLFIIILNNPRENQYSRYAYNWDVTICNDRPDLRQPQWSNNGSDGHTYLCEPRDVLSKDHEEIKLYRENGTRWLDSKMELLPLPQSAITATDKSSE